MLWEASHKRVARETRERLTELFVAGRDAGKEVLVSTGQAKPVGAWRQPPYTTAREVASQPLRSPAARDAALAGLNLMYPGIVRRLDA